MRKKQITKQERLQLIGLVILQNKANKMINECDAAMVDIIGQGESPTDDRAGHLSELIFEDTTDPVDVDKALKKMEIKVE